MFKQVDIIENPDIVVRYNGYIDKDYGYFLRNQVKKYLKIGKTYNVRLICKNFNCVDGNDYFALEGISNWFPCKSFDIINKRDLMIEKYDLI